MAIHAPSVLKEASRLMSPRVCLVVTITFLGKRGSSRLIFSGMGSLAPLIPLFFFIWIVSVFTGYLCVSIRHRQVASGKPRLSHRVGHWAFLGGPSNSCSMIIVLHLLLL